MCANNRQFFLDSNVDFSVKIQIAVTKWTTDTIFFAIFGAKTQFSKINPDFFAPKIAKNL